MTDELAVAMERFQRCIEGRDRAAAEQVLHHDYALVLITPERAVMPRARWLEVLAEYVVHEYEIQDRVVDVDETAAAVVHRVRMSATVLGEDRSGLFVISDFWRRRDDGWRLWRRHSTALSAGGMPGVTS